MSSENLKSNRDRSRHYFNIVHKSLELLVVTIGVGIAFCALKEYKKANAEYRRASVVSMFAKLSEQNTVLYNRLYQNDGLNSFWATLPEGLTIKEKADMRLKLLFVKNEKEGKASRMPTIKWKNVTELDDLIWLHDTFGDPSYRQLRDGNNFAEEILAMESSAFFAKQQELMTEEEGDTFSTLLQDIGEHPLYLASVAWNHDTGGFTEPFAHYLKNRYLNNKDLKAVALALYPEMINDPDWEKKTGNK